MISGTDVLGWTYQNIMTTTFLFGQRVPKETGFVDVLISGRIAGILSSPVSHKAVS